MEFVYTKHAEDKLKEPESKHLGINKAVLESVVRGSKFVEDLGNSTRSTGQFSAELSLVVVYKRESGKMKIITFFPAEKGRYESKILRGR